MRQVYHNEVVITEPTPPGHYVYDIPVSPGKVLLVRNLAVYWAGFKTSQTGQWFIQDGGRKIFLGDDTPARESGHAYWTGQVYVGEGDQIGVFCPDSELNDTIYFYISGELLDLADFRG